MVRERDNKKMEKRSNIDRILVDHLQRDGRFADYVIQKNIDLANKFQFIGYRDSGGPLYHCSNVPPHLWTEFDINYLLTNPEFTAFFNRLGPTLKNMLRGFHAKKVLMPEWMLNIHLGQQVMWQRIPHLDRTRNPHLNSHRPNPCRYAYLGCHLTKSIHDHMYSADKRYFYGPGVVNGGTDENTKVRYVYVFDNNEEITHFVKVDDAPHQFLGKSLYGAVLKKCIKIVMRDDSDSLVDADWSEIAI